MNSPLLECFWTDEALSTDSGFPFKIETNHDQTNHSYYIFMYKYTQYKNTDDNLITVAMSTRNSIL